MKEIFYSVVDSHDQLPELTVSEDDLELACIKTFGEPREFKAVPPSAYLNSDWSRTHEHFFRERIVHVRSNNVLLLRFDYSYEIDLNRIKTERDLLAWVLQLIGKSWMGAERTEIFIETVVRIKNFNAEL